MLDRRMGSETCHIHRASVRGRKFFIVDVLVGHSRIGGRMLGFIGK